MREHGVLRRALLVYTESVPKIRANPGIFPADALTRTAKLFRSFGEDYHERRLAAHYERGRPLRAINSGNASSALAPLTTCVV